MRERWKQAGLILLSLLAVAAVYWATVALIAGSGMRMVPIISYGALGIACLVAYLVAVRFIERRVPTELSLRHGLALPLGALGGIALFSLVMGVLWAAGVYQPRGLDILVGHWRAAALWLAVAVQEEVLFRGLVFRLSQKVVGTWGALIAAAVLFGAAHAGNTGWTATGLASVALAGVMFASAYVATGRLWLPIGLHAGWNFAESSVFGLSVSGNRARPGLIAGDLDGPDIWTGGRFGPEASIVAVVLVLAVSAGLIWWIVRQRRTEPPIWRAGT